jgi:Na+/melibiose symporter-like transporter
MKECSTETCFSGSGCTTLSFLFGMIVGTIVRSESSLLHMVGYMILSGVLFYCAYSLSYTNVWNRLLGKKVTHQL